MPSPAVHGVDVDETTGCAHYRSDRDIVAFELPCCDRFWACIECHDAVADHDAQPIADPDRPSVLCGRCNTTISARTYLQAAHRCPVCDSPFNPGCAAHYDRYFTADVLAVGTADDGGR